MRVFLRGLAFCIIVATVAAAMEAPGVWLDVPFVKQQKNGCGAACISMVMQYWKGKDGRTPYRPVDEATIQSALYSRRARGVLASDMERYFQESGFQTFVFKGEWTDLREHLSKGRPLIVCLQESRRTGLLHYVVVAGVEGQRQAVLVNDPAQRKLLRISWTAFERGWNATDRWSLLALPDWAK